MRILIISEYIAPVRAVAALRWTKLGKYLKESCGCEIDVLTNKKSFVGSVADAQYYEYDETTAHDLMYFDHIYEIPGTWLSKSLMKAIAFTKLRLFHGKGMASASSEVKLEGERRMASRALSWFRQSTACFIGKLYGCYLAYLDHQRVRSVEKMQLPLGGYNAIISTYSPKWTHLVAEKIKARRSDILWIADYRDAVTDSDARNTFTNQSFARRHTGTADFILGVSDAVINRLNIDARQERYTIPHGYDAEDLQMRKRQLSNRFILSYTGTLYHESNYVSDLAPAFAALQNLIERGAVSRDDILVVYCGVSSVEFIKQASDYPLVPIEDRGFVTREHAMEIQNESSLLIYTTCNNNIYDSGLSGKTYEYLSSNVPLLALCSGNKPDAMTSKFFREANAGFAYEEACREYDFPRMREYIERMYADWKTTGLTSAKTDWSYVETNDYARLAQELYRLIEGFEQKTSVEGKC